MPNLYIIAGHNGAGKSTFGKNLLPQNAQKRVSIHSITSLVYRIFTRFTLKMHRNPLLQLLKNHQPFNPEETQFKQQMIEFINQNPDCFERTLLTGHITGSAWIVDKTRQFTLLTHHRKLDKWFQTGGHCDGDSDVLNVAMKEALEETGLIDIQVISPNIFDIDIHAIPERKGVPQHLHYDVRFLLEADINEPLIVSSESSDLAWVEISKVSQLNDSQSIMRMVCKG